MYLHLRVPTRTPWTLRYRAGRLTRGRRDAGYWRRTRHMARRTDARSVALAVRHLKHVAAAWRRRRSAPASPAAGCCRRLGPRASTILGLAGGSAARLAHHNTHFLLLPRLTSPRTSWRKTATAANLIVNKRTLRLTPRLLLRGRAPHPHAPPTIQYAKCAEPERRRRLPSDHECSRHQYDKATLD